MSDTKRKRVAYAADGKVYCRQCTLEMFATFGGPGALLNPDSWGEDDELIHRHTGGLVPIDEVLARALWGPTGRSCDVSVCDAVIVEPGPVEPPFGH